LSIKYRETEKSRAFAYISFENPADAEVAAREMNGKTLDGKTIKIEQVNKPSFESDGRQRPRPLLRNRDPPRCLRGGKGGSGEARGHPSHGRHLGNVLNVHLSSSRGLFLVKRGKSSRSAGPPPKRCASTGLVQSSSGRGDKVIWLVCAALTEMPQVDGFMQAEIIQVPETLSIMLHHLETVVIPSVELNTPLKDTMSMIVTVQVVIEIILNMQVQPVAEIRMQVMVRVIHLQFVNQKGISGSALPARGSPVAYSGSSLYDDYRSPHGGYGRRQENYSSSRSDTYSSHRERVIVSVVEFMVNKFLIERFLKVIEKSLNYLQNTVFLILVNTTSLCALKSKVQSHRNQNGLKFSNTTLTKRKRTLKSRNSPGVSLDNTMPWSVIALMRNQNGLKFSNTTLTKRKRTLKSRNIPGVSLDNSMPWSVIALMR
ncbi:uncharacterized protein LOC103213202, partial [Orycteropus afer afer]|uniref:Uncharacterized protein LOC103213202 n=1 Tax=Orycteropus afer afer TaxID=1230840 RepID=A0AC54ZFB5_ORYAF